MRTTISIQDALLKKAKQASLARNCSLSEVVEDALRHSLVAKTKFKEATNPRPLKTFRGSGLQPGVDLASGAGLLEIMEGR